MTPVHPGRILKKEVKARELWGNAWALALRVPSGRITAILNEQRSVSADTALRLARYFGNSAQFWLNLQSRYDLAKTEREYGATIEKEVQAG